MSTNPIAPYPPHGPGGVIDNNAGSLIPPQPPRGTPGPTIRLPQIVAYLQDQDVDRAAGFKTRLKILEEYLEDCDRLRREGHADFDANLTGMLYEAQTLTKVHRFYERFTKGLTRPYNIIPRKLKFPTRLAFYDRKAPMPCPNPDSKPSLYTSLIPRRDAIWHPPFVSIRQLPESPDWDNYYASDAGRDMLRWYQLFRIHQNHLWNIPPGMKGNWGEIRNFRDNSNPNALNYAELEEESYRRCMLIEEAQIPNPPPITPLNIPSAGDDGDKAISRGWKRAMIQRCMNLVDNEENRRVNSPWRRVKFPPPYEKFKEVHFQPKALVRELRNINTMVMDKRKDRCAQSEPSPWVYWYNQYLQQANYLSAWSRQAFVQQNWKNLEQIAVPVNYTGPYIFLDKCIYHEYWLRMGKSLVLLWNIINRERELDAARAENGQTRFLLQAVARDILAGVQGDKPPFDVIPRPEVDTVVGQPDTYQLVDEIDMAWLRFLVQPSANRALAGLSSQQPQDTLMVLFDHRIQTMFNDLVNNPFKVAITAKDAEGKPTQSWGRQYIPLNADLLDMLNRGGRVHYTDKEQGFDYWTAAEINDTKLRPPNELYQFTPEEAEGYCEALARMGRVEYLRPCPTNICGPKGETRWRVEGQYWLYQDQNWGGRDRGYVSMPYMETHPEMRIRWRHRSKSALARFNQTYMDDYVNGRFESIQTSPDRMTQRPRSVYEDNFLRERMWKRGVYSAEGVEYRRKAPSWDDLVDYSVAVDANVGLADRTIQFFRNLAFRMGRTIRHYNWLLEQASLPSPFTRDDLHRALDQWRDNVQQGRRIGEENSILAHPFKLSPPQDVILKAQPWHDKAKSKDLIEVYTTIRHGIIDDLVQNRTMLYPGRETAYTDRRKFLTQTYDRANIWSWASVPVRKNHAVYRRERYFDMRRWPLNRQKEPTRKRIQTREDEDPSLQPVSAWYKYRIVVGPTPCKGTSPGTLAVRSRSGDPYAEMNEILRTLDIPRQKLSLKLWEDFLKDLRQVMGTKTIDTKNLLWRTRIVPPTHQVIPLNTTETTGGTETKGTKRTTRIKEAMEIKETAGAATQDTQRIQSSQTTGNMHAERVRLRPMTRPDEVFIPGPALFPMGDTLLQQVKISQEIEQILDPKPDGGIVSNILGWFKPAPDRVPLLPDIDLNRVPATNPLKRKVPSAFVRAADPDLKVPTVTDPTTNGPMRPARGSTTTTYDQLKPRQNDYLVRPRQIAAGRSTGPRTIGTGNGGSGGVSGGGSRGTSGGESGGNERAAGGNGGDTGGNNGNSSVSYHAPLTPPPSGPRPLSPPPPPLPPAKRFNSPIQPVDASKTVRFNASTGGGTNVHVDALNDIFKKSGMSTVGTGSEPPPARPSKPKALPTPPRASPVPVDDVTYMDDVSQTLDVAALAADKEDLERQERMLQQYADAKATQAALDAGKPHPLIQKFIKRLEVDFPMGWETMPTSGSQLMCGFHAIIGSMKAQFPALPQPTLEELQECFYDDGLRANSLVAGVTNEDDFTFDQLGATLWTWGAYRGYEMQMGVIFTTGEPFVCPIVNTNPADEDRFANHLLWVHNNSTPEQTARSRQRDKELALANGGALDAQDSSNTPSFNHYSGVRHKS